MNYINRICKSASESRAARAAFSALGLLGVAAFGFCECVRCGKTAVTVPLCDECAGLLRNYEALCSVRRCALCGKPLVSESAAASDQAVCMECRENPVSGSLDALYPLHTYRQWKKDLVFAWKTEGQRRISPLFASLVYKALREISLESLPLVPVPPRPGKIKEKGWDQVEELAAILDKRHGIRIERMLLRISAGQQKKLGRAERLGSEGAVYSLLPGLKAVPREIVLLDDIVTTGATMEKCAWLLKKAGVKKVTGLSLFIVD